jgi:hypothetical protein
MRGVEPGAILVNADEGFLSQVGGVGFIVQLAHQVMEETLAVAVHEGAQRDILARAQARHVLSILLVSAGSHHAEA